jgi:alkyl hydroperoxide reductase subunit F
MAQATIYSKKGCPFCSKAKSFLEEKGITFEEIETLAGSTTWQEMQEKTGSGTLPQILIGEESIGGYSDLVNLYATGELNQKLGRDLKGDLTPLYDVLIIGGGPAGLSAAVYACRKILKTLLITKYLGGQVTWTYDVDNYLGFSQVEAADLVSKFEDHVEKYGLEQMLGTKVVSAELFGKTKKVTTSDGKTYLSKTVILATGKRPKMLNVPGEKKLLGMGVTYCSTCDAPLFADLDVAVAGGGNSALEAVLDLKKVANRVYLVSLTPLTADLFLQDKVKQEANVEVLTAHEVVGIVGESTVEGIQIKSLATDERKELSVSGIIVEIGLLPNSELAIDTLETNHIGEIVVDARCRTGLSGVFACGDVTNVPYKQVIVAAGEGAKAALAAYDYIISQR